MITLSLLRSWDACWSDEQIRERIAGRKSVTAREVAADESISLDDRLWVLTHLLAHLDEFAARLYAVECALSVAHLAGDEDDQAQYLGICNRLIEIEDLPEDERAAARAAAWDATWAATRAATRAAARAAAWDATWAATWAAAWDATWAATWDAAWAATWNAARAAALRSHLARALEWLGDYADRKAVRP